MTETERQIFEPDGRAVPYVDEGAGPALVLVPGKGIDPVHLGTLAHVLIEEDFRVVRVGSRHADADGTSLQDAAQDVVDVMDHLGIADAWVGGHAFGGTVARAVALAHHEKVNGVLLLAVEADTPAEAAVAPGVPVLIIQGSEDDATPPANGEQLLASAPELVSLVTIEGAGHLFAATHAGETAAVIEDYLDWD
jgi:pimeloyl-ACP methyl ester carboxylesterase